MKVCGSGFIGPQILNFERSLSLSRGPKEVLFRLAKFLLEALLIVDVERPSDHLYIY